MKYFTILILPILLFSCGIGRTELDTLNKKKLNFEELPSHVQAIYTTEIEKEKSGFQYEVISDDDFSFKHKHTGMDDGLIVLMTQGFNHHFYINDKHFTLQANQGAPFVLHDKKLYYTTELNISKQNYRGAEYIEIDITDFIN